MAHYQGYLQRISSLHIGIGQLEEKVNKHNNLIERMVAVEASAKSAHKRLDELSEEVKEHE